MLLRPACVIQRNKDKSRILAEAVSAGSGGCRILYEEEGRNITAEETPVFIGVWPSTLAVLRERQRSARPFVTLDNGYFKPYKQGGYFRATTNAMQWLHEVRKPVERDVAAERFARLGLTINPWQSNPEGHILIVSQSDRWMEMFGLRDWAKKLKAEFRDRGLSAIVREKPLRTVGRQPDFYHQLRGCRAVVGFSSNALVEAAMQGYPVFPQAPCAASAFGQAGTDISRTVFPERLPLLYQLAANQWHIDEISSGRMWRELGERYETHFPRLA